MGLRNLFSRSAAGRETVERLLMELDQEMAKTRLILDRVPEGRFGWTPHEKSFTLGQLANHLAALPVMGTFIISGLGRKPAGSISKAEMLAVFETRKEALRAALAGCTDDYLSQSIFVKPGEARQRVTALQSMVLNHMIHHRGQLSAYLRLLDESVPGMYGPSADEELTPRSA